MVSMRAIADGVAMPREYDTECGRRFRNRFAYLMPDPMNRTAEPRAALVNTLIATS